MIQARMTIPPVVGHVVEELLHVRLLTGNPGGFQLGLVSLRRNVALDHLAAESFTKMILRKIFCLLGFELDDLAFHSGDLLVVPSCSGNHLRQLQLKRKPIETNSSIFFSSLRFVFKTLFTSS